MGQEITKKQFWGMAVIAYLCEPDTFGLALDRVEQCQERYNLTKKMEVNMWAQLMSSMAIAAGVPICIWACVKAMQWASSTGEYESERDAANSQDVWAKAAELQEQIDPNTGRRRK